MILITGDSGFIGSYLTKELLNNGYEIHGLDINGTKKYPVEYEYTVGNILDKKKVLQSLQGCDCIINLAAAHKDFGITEEEYYSVNVEGTRNLLHYATECGVKKFIFYSSVAVYGNNQPSTEETTPNPINQYGGSKLEAEKVIEQWAKEDASREVIIIRPAVVFGPLNVANIFKLIKQVCDGHFMWVGQGENIKSVAYVENVVDATIFLLKKMTVGVEIFNYSDEPQMSTCEIVSLISKKSGVKVSKIHIPLSFALFGATVFDMIGKITGYDFSITAARISKFNTATEHRAKKIREWGFEPKHTLNEGFGKNVLWYNENKSASSEHDGE